MLTPSIIFAGVDSPKGASVSMTHGISPGVFTIEMVPQPDFPAAGGTLAISDGTVNLSWANCIVDYNSLEMDSHSRNWRLQGFDRRWMWQYGTISGLYNVRNGDFSVDSATRKTVTELATLCLDAMGETSGDWDLSGLPDIDPPPMVEWDCEVPAEALARLVDMVGCRIVPQLDGSFSVQTAGEGATLPNDNILSTSLTINPPQKPDALAINCGKTLFGFIAPLEAVGLEVDGTIQPIDDLSYLPDGGWGGVDVKDFLTVGDGDFSTAARKIRALAQKTVFRWYRIKLPFDLPGYGDATGAESDTVDDWRDILPINAYTWETYTEVGTNIKVYHPAVVFGVWWAGPDVNNVLPPSEFATFDPTELETCENAAYHRGFQIDTSRGIVMFSEPVYMNTKASEAGDKHDFKDGFAMGPARLWLRASCNARDPDTLGAIRYQQSQSLGDWGTQPRYYRHDELALVISPTYAIDTSDAEGPTAYQSTGTSDNSSDVDAQCNYYLTAAQADYQMTLPQQVTYIGLRDVDLDGAIQHAVYEIRDRAPGITTILTRNCEHQHYTVPYRERRAAEDQRQLRRNNAAQPIIIDKTVPGGNPEPPWGNL